jgi:hypothetical protein
MMITYSSYSARGDTTFGDASRAADNLKLHMDTAAGKLKMKQDQRNEVVQLKADEALLKADQRQLKKDKKAGLPI